MGWYLRNTLGPRMYATLRFSIGLCDRQAYYTPAFAVIVTAKGLEAEVPQRGPSGWMAMGGHMFAVL